MAVGVQLHISSAIVVIMGIKSIAVVVFIVLSFTGCSSSAEPQNQKNREIDVSQLSVNTDDLVKSDPTTEEQEQINRWESEDWDSDYSRRTVDLSEIQSGGPGRDGIPAIDEPQFDSISDAKKWLDDAEPVIEYENKAYPLQILMWHEIANDLVNDIPISVTFCPLCNTALVFDRRHPDIGEISLGVSGKLRRSDMVMYDRTSDTFFQQFDGIGIAGDLAGTRLATLPSQVVSFGEFIAQHPDGTVLNTDTGHSRDYGANPYAGYDEVGSQDIFGVYESTGDDRLEAKERMIFIENGAEEQNTAFAITDIAAAGVINDGTATLWSLPRAKSALDAPSIAGSRVVGGAVVYNRAVDGKRLSFTARAGSKDQFTDTQSGSIWNREGLATQGPMKGKQLLPIQHVNVFWFAVAAFTDGLVLYKPDELA